MDQLVWSTLTGPVNLLLGFPGFYDNIWKPSEEIPRLSDLKPAADI